MRRPTPPRAFQRPRPRPTRPTRIPLILVTSPRRRARAGTYADRSSPRGRAGPADVAHEDAAAADADAAAAARWSLRLNLGREPGTGMAGVRRGRARRSCCARTSRSAPPRPPARRRFVGPAEARARCAALGDRGPLVLDGLGRGSASALGAGGSVEPRAATSRARGAAMLRFWLEARRRERRRRSSRPLAGSTLACRSGTPSGSFSGAPARRLALAALIAAAQRALDEHDAASGADGLGRACSPRRAAPSSSRRARLREAAARRARSRPCPTRTKRSRAARGRQAARARGDRHRFARRTRQYDASGG